MGGAGSRSNLHHVLCLRECRRLEIMSSSSSRHGGLTITYLELKALTYAVKHFPERTPKRWELIATFVSEATLYREDVSPLLQLSKRGGPTFSPVPSDCQKAHEILLCNYPAVLEHIDFSEFDALYQHPQKDAFKPLVLMPAGVDRCCGMPTLVRNRLSHPIMYTTRLLEVRTLPHAFMQNVARPFARRNTTSRYPMVKRHSSIFTTQMIAIIISKSAHRPFLRRSYLKISPTTSQSVVLRLNQGLKCTMRTFPLLTSTG